MARLRPRRSSLIALVAAFVTYLVVGHGWHPGKTMDEAAAAAGICIVLITVVAAVVVAAPRALTPPVGPISLAVSAVPPRRAASAARSRASPQWLQRFLN